ncbi:hypothetical protein BGX26_010358 [Mortierella sp. AD094]|nr:hypothetical protein BGX26_010358 [Mortierella sp. AD094]
MPTCCRRFPTLRSNSLPFAMPQDHHEPQPNLVEDADIPHFFTITEVIDVIEPAQIALLDRVRGQVDATPSRTALSRLVGALLVLCICLAIQIIMSSRT